MIETLETCIRTGNFGPLRDLYDADPRLEAFLPSETIGREDSDEIIGQFTEWWPSEGTLARSLEADLVRLVACLILVAANPNHAVPET